MHNLNEFLSLTPRGVECSREIMFCQITEHSISNLLVWGSQPNCEETQQVTPETESGQGEPDNPRIQQSRLIIQSSEYRLPHTDVSWYAGCLKKSKCCLLLISCWNIPQISFYCNFGKSSLSWLYGNSQRLFKSDKKCLRFFKKKQRWVLKKYLFL